MTLNGVRDLIELLTSYYPKNYSPNMTDERRKRMTKDFLELYEKFDDKYILKSYKELAKVSDNCPSIPAVLDKARGFKAEDTTYSPPQTKTERGPNLHGRAVIEMLRVRRKMKDPWNDPHDLKWYYDNYPGALSAEEFLRELKR